MFGKLSIQSRELLAIEVIPETSIEDENENKNTKGMTWHVNILALMVYAEKSV